MRKKLASLLVAGGLLATLSISGLFVVQQNQVDPGGSGGISSPLPNNMIPMLDINQIIKEALLKEKI